MTPPELLQLFLQDLKTHLPLLESNLEKLQQGGNPQEFFPHLESSARAISGSARLVQFASLALLAQAIELAAKQKKDLSLIANALPLLRQIAESDPSSLTQKVDELQISIQELLKKDQTKPSQEAASPSPEKVLFDHTMMDLFRSELESNVKILNEGLIEVEGGRGNPELFQALMRAAHSVKGAARVVRLEPIVQLAHVIEDCFVAAQKGQLILQPFHADAVLKGIDLIDQLSKVPDAAVQDWIESKKGEIATAAEQIKEAMAGKEVHGQPLEKAPAPIWEQAAPSPTADRVLRITAQNLNRLMGLAGESLVESRWLQPFSNALMAVKKQISDLSHSFDLLREALEPQEQNEKLQHYLTEVHHKVAECSQNLNNRLTDLDLFIIRNSNLSDRLYREVIDSRMRPFSDGTGGFPRLVRDLARELGKKVRLEIIGKETPVDRDILEKLEAPLSHLLRNAVDHGIETPEVRESQGKPAEGTIKLEAQHRAGMLAISISDDGKGLDLEGIRQKVIEKNLVQPAVAQRLTQPELLEFLFLPGFSTAKSVTEISGRGVGLNVVQSMVQEVGGSVRALYEPNKGMSFHLQLPLTLSVIRALLAEISGEPYAFPLSRIERTLQVPKEQVAQVESRQYIQFEGQNIGLVPAAQVLEVQERQLAEATLPLIVFSERLNYYGVVVDKLLGERELVVHELDPRLGKVADISAGALMEDGSPILIVDVEDMVRSIDAILSGGRLHKLQYGEKGTAKRRKRILVVDDSITVREVECRLLQNQGYDAQTAVNGMDGWNALRMGDFDLLLTDVDMPRMNGIELIRLVRSDPRLKNLPILIVSYKEREEDRRLGLEAGANYYLTKSSFHDESLIHAVIDLIGKEAMYT